MAVLPKAFLHHASFDNRNINSIPIITSKPKLKFRNSTLAQTLAKTILSVHNPNSIYTVKYMPVSHVYKQNRGDFCDRRDEISMTKRWLEFRDFFPSGRWWNLHDLEQNIDGVPIATKPMTVISALSQILALIADDKWILYTAFGALTVATVSEISMPGILAASVFSAQNEAVGNLTSRVNTDCQRLSQAIGNDIHLILRNFLQGTGAFITLMTLSWPLALSSLVVCFILSMIFLIYGQYQKKAALLAQNFVASANEAAQETLSSMRTIRAYGTEREEFQRFTQWIDKLAVVGMRESAANGLWTLSFHTLYRSTQVLAIVLGGTSILTGYVSTEQLTKYVFYCEWLIYAARRLQDSMSSLLQSIGACEKVFQLMHLSPSSEFLSKGVKLQKLMGHIDFVNVSFHYSSRKMVPVLQNANFSIKVNEVVAIVGSSGSGKTTLINLLLRLYEPVNGEIRIDGIPLREMDIRWLREKIGFVGQEPHLFHIDVKSNIIYGCTRSTREEDVEFAARNANAHKFITALPSGYDTVIDDNLLSGGQKQRIAIARALLRDPTILVLDEPTSALDADSEGYIKEILLSLKNNARRQRTIIIIAQRLSTIKAADRILVLNDGQVAESGTHTELVKKNGPYARLFKTQASEGEAC